MKLKRYSKYKNSGIDWIGEIPEGWEVRKIKHFSNTVAGGTPSTAIEKYWEGNIPWLPSGLVHDNIIKEESIFKFITFEALQNSSTKWIKPNSVLIALTGATCGNIGYINFRTTANQSVIGMEVNKNMDSIFLYYYLLTQKEQILINQTGGAQGGINQENVKDIFCSIPPLQTQQKISSFLDFKTSQIEKLIEKDKKLIELLKERRVSLINKAVTKGLDDNVKMKDSRVDWIGEIPEGWEVRKFKHLFNFGKGLNITKENLKDEGVPCVNYGEIHSKYGFELNPLKHLLKCVDESYLKSSRKSLLKKGDFIFADTSEDLEGSGNFTFLNSDITTFAGYHTVITRHIGNINYKFLAYLFDSVSFRNQIRKIVKGVKVYSITNYILKETFLLYPGKENQQKIVDFLDRETEKIDSHVKKVEERIRLYGEYKKSLIYNVVTGKVEV